MRVVIQRVRRASVSVGGEVRSRIGAGMMVLVGVGWEDTGEDGEWLAAKIAGLRIFDDGEGVMNRSVVETGGEVMVVSQFTLMARTRRGNRPSYVDAAGGEVAVPLYEGFVRAVEKATGRKVATGVFGADMEVELVNDGPVTIVMDSRNRV